MKVVLYEYYRGESNLDGKITQVINANAALIIRKKNLVVWYCAADIDGADFAREFMDYEIEDANYRSGAKETEYPEKLISSLKHYFEWKDPITSDKKTYIQGIQSEILSLLGEL